ncbi:MAG: phosphoglycerate kinase, partial [Thaumarchaeota archaeon]|nr:phosphoglycerate kinase [Nitrososphaerota archaeon]
INEAAMTIRDLEASKVVVASHQGRVGRYDYVPMAQHAAALSGVLNKDVAYVEDICGPAARDAITNMDNGDVLLLDNLRFLAEETMEFSPEEASKTVFVQRLCKHLDVCVLDAFPTAHRAHPSIVGFSYLLPTCAGRVVAKELKALSRLASVEKGPYTTVLGGAKVSDRLEAIDTLIENNRADKVLLGGLLATVFLKAAGKMEGKVGIDGEEKYVKKARDFIQQFPSTFELPTDVATGKNGERVEISVEDMNDNTTIFDIGSRTIDHYSRIIRSSGTVFMSGPPGLFEKPGFSIGTENLLRAMGSSLGTTIVSGGHLTAALQRFGIKDSIDHVSTSGGALVLFLAGKRLPLIEALQRAAERYQK